MSHYNVQWLPNENIIVEQVPVDFDLRRDTIPANRAVITALDSATCPVPYILDLSQIPAGYGISGNMLAAATRGDGPAYSHRNILALCIVGSTPLFATGALAMAQAKHNGIEAQVFKTYNEALAYARSLAPQFTVAHA